MTEEEYWARRRDIWDEPPPERPGGFYDPLAERAFEAWQRERDRRLDALAVAYRKGWTPHERRRESKRWRLEDAQIEADFKRREGRAWMSVTRRP